MVVLCCLVGTATAQTTRVVTSTGDSGAGTLRKAVTDAVSGDFIVFNVTLPATITLTSGEIALNKNLTILGPGADQLTLDGNGSSRLFNITETVTIEGLTITNGSHNDFGGCIYVDGDGDNGTLTLRYCAVTNCDVTGGTNVGGGMAVYGSNADLTVENSLFTGNDAGHGGAIHIDSTPNTIEITNSTFSANDAQTGAGAIGLDDFNAVGDENVVVTNSTFFDNFTVDTSGGAALASYTNGDTFTLKNTLFDDNTCGNTRASPTFTDCALGDNKNRFASNGGNINDGTFVSDNLSATNDQTGAEPLLNALAANNGPTQTHSLQASSPAKSNAVSATLGVDQRGFLHASDSGAYEDGSQAGPLINEFMPNPGSEDTNGDATADAAEDEFVEIYNPGTSSLDLEGFTLLVGGVTKHTFPAGTVVAANKAVVVFGGGTPTGIPALAQTASTGSLDLPDGAGTISLKNDAATPELVESVAYANTFVNAANAAKTRSSLAAGVSINRYPDLSRGTQLGHDVIPGGIGNYSPGEDAAGAPLPVELTAFEAHAEGPDVVLRWTTASETNNAGFEIQHRPETAPAGSLPWETLAFVDGQGTTGYQHLYQYPVPNLQPGRHVFRLKQIDFDGTFEYSPEVEVLIEAPRNYVSAHLYPNPFRSTTTFALTLGRAQRIRVEVVDLLGRRVALLYEGPIASGVEHTLRFEAGGLSSGVYVIRAVGESFMTSETVLVLK